MSQEKLRILLIVQPERTDFYNYLSKAENIEWILLWYEKPGQMFIQKSELPLDFLSVHYWIEFRTPKELLKKVKPHKIIFFEIIDLRQIALNITAISKKIPTFYLEHGAAGDSSTAIIRWKEIGFRRQKLPYLLKRFKDSSVNILRSKFFYYSVICGFRSIKSYIQYLILPVKMLAGSPNKILTLNRFPERVPEKSIVFNQANFEEYSLYTGIREEKALLTGVPFFDDYYKKANNDRGYIVYIDAPFLEEKLCEWTPQHHSFIANKLFEFARVKRIKLYIKLHPKSNLDAWLTYIDIPENVTILQQGNYMDLYLDSSLILGYSSTLMNGFLCAKKNIVLLGWHPNPHIFGVNFSATGLCHVSLNPDELFTEFEKWTAHNLAIENAEAYDRYLKRFNYPFDGKATERIIKAITEDEVS